MKKRIFYIISFLLIFCIEVLIALYVRDNFMRPYVGDMLVVVLVYSFVRIFLPTEFRGCRLMSFFCLFCGSATILPVGGKHWGSQTVQPESFWALRSIERT